MKLPFLAAVLAVLTGCAVVTDPTPATLARIQPPPMPPLPGAKRSFAAQPTVITPAFAVVAPEPITTNRIYIAQNHAGPYLWWMTNEWKNYVLTSTNYMLSIQQWEPLSVRGATVTDGIASIPITNRSAPIRFYRLLSVPTNHIVFSWRYNFTNQEVGGFKLYQGGAIRAYATNFDIPDIWLWKSYAVTGTNRTFYAFTAYDKSGIESDLSSEVDYRPWEVIATTNQP